MVAPSRGGFTLVEAMVAMTLSSILVVLVSTTFLVQNRFYALQTERSAAQDNARVVTDMVGSELRSLTKGGVDRAEEKRLVVRSPMVITVVCGQASGPKASVQIAGGIADLATSEVGGVARLDTASGTWTYKDAKWSDFYAAGYTPAKDCQSNGADTVGVTSEFRSFTKLNSYFGTQPPNGTVLMVYRKIEYRFNTSTMDPTSTALYRGPTGGTLVEFATGMDTSARFLYRVSGTYRTSVTGTDRDKIDAIRIEAQARRKPRAGGLDDVTFGWGVNVFLRNVR